MIKESINEISASIDNCHNLLYVLNKIEEYKDDLDKQDIINILYYYYLFNKDIFDNIL
jgi:hypothetical protein